ALVWTAWDLGIRDATAIWFAQMVGREIRIIDYYEASGVDLGHYARELMAKPYAYAGHIVPHDAQAKELGTGKSRLEVLETLGLRTLTVAPAHSMAAPRLIPPPPELGFTHRPLPVLIALYHQPLGGLLFSLKIARSD